MSVLSRLLTRSDGRPVPVDGIELVGAGGGPGEGVPGGDEPVSSTRIRRALVAGDLALANRLLGRDYEVRGVVALGDKRGRELGFPTANVSVPGDILLPADGIYAGWFERPDGTVYPSAISLGRRPTFYVEAHVSLLEAHLSNVSNQLNSIMKVLTIISTIIMPMTVLTGMYGMNVPLPHLPGGEGAQFWWILAIMGSVTTAMLVFFRRRGWL